MSYLNDKFKLASVVKKFIIESEDLLANIPRHDFYNRDKFKDEVSNILYLIYLANNIEDKEVRLKYQYDILARVSMIDFYLERAYVLKYISEKQLYNYIKKLEVIIKMTKGWIKYNG